MHTYETIFSVNLIFSGISNHYLFPITVTSIIKKKFLKFVEYNYNGNFIIMMYNDWLLFLYKFYQSWATCGKLDEISEKKFRD